MYHSTLFSLPSASFPVSNVSGVHQSYEPSQLCQYTIIERLDGPTPWVSPIVVAPKPTNPNKIPFCMDMRLPIKAILRSRHITPTFDVSDHQPLKTIFNNPKSKIHARIERWRPRLQQYNFDVKYKPGKSNAADYMSGHPDMKPTMFKHAERYVHYISENAVPKAMTIQEIADSTSKDAELQSVITAVKTNKWEKSYVNSTLDTFSTLKYELTVVPVNHGEILFHDNRILIPKNLQMRVIDITHELHQGIVRTKQLWREKVYFPGIDKLVEKTCKSCIPCLASIPNYRV